MGDLPRLALSIRQPWAWAIINAGKNVENRDWSTRFRGPVCIHASKGMTQGEYHDARDCIRYATRYTHVVPASTELFRGGIIGVAEIADCVEDNPSPWFFGRYGFVLRNARPVPFFPVRGALGFFDWRKSAQEPSR